MIKEDDLTKKCKNQTNDTKSRYNSLIKRSFELLLRYKLYEEQNQKSEFISKCFIKSDDKSLDCKCFFVDDLVKKEFSILYNNMNSLRKVNKYAEELTEKHKKDIKIFKKAYIEHFKEKIMSEYEFKKLWDAPRKCGYCGISEDQIKELCAEEKIKTKRFYSRGKTMEIDKIEPKGEYCKNNIILSCYWCNNAKTDEFSLTEFEPIARGIHEAWEKRLSQNVIFPADTYARIEK